MNQQIQKEWVYLTDRKAYYLTKALFKWNNFVKIHNKSLKKLARLKHSLTILSLKQLAGEQAFAKNLSSLSSAGLTRTESVFRQGFMKREEKLDRKPFSVNLNAA